VLRLHQRGLLETRHQTAIQNQEGDEGLNVRIGILVSGRGSNLGAILEAVKRNYIRKATVALVVSNKPGVRALEIAKRYGVDTQVIETGGMDRASYDARVLRALVDRGVDSKNGLVLLAGFMRMLSPEFVDFYRGRIMNIHPSLLPAFPGLDAQKQALEHGVKVAGCTVHFVVPELDAGPIIVQKAVKVTDEDTVETLSARILKQEHAIYPLAAKLFVEGKLSINGREVLIKD
jgi:phosphoribosylglycinamide formyltransferase 1